MKIALISYEYPPDTADGGIATYTRQVARVMYARGHHVEVFGASRHRSGTDYEDGFAVHRLNVEKSEAFSERVGPIFAARHREVGFDVLEGPEYGAHAREAVRLAPDIPYVIRLHTPSYLIYEMNFSKATPLKRARFYLGALRRGNKPPWHPDAGPERVHTAAADEVAALCQSLGNQMVSVWHLDPQRLSCYPYPYTPSEKLLQIPIETRTNTVSFVGRLEARKGILDLADAIPQILRQQPATRFRFIGKPVESPLAKVNMQQYLERKLARYRHSLEFTGAVPLDQIPILLADTDICVFPSLWENFPSVCLEAMFAGRGIVGSKAGGMTEMLDSGRSGILVSPHSPTEIAGAVLDLLENPSERIRLGQAARTRATSIYNCDRIAALQEASYKKAIAHRHAHGPRQELTLGKVH